MKLINKLLLATVLIAGAGYTAAAKPHHHITNIKASEIVDRHLSGFNAINAAGPFDIYVTQGPVESVNVEAPSDVIDRIKTEVEGGTLKIYNKHDSFNWGDLWGFHKKIAVYVVVKDITSINLSGSGDVFFNQGLTAGSLKLHVSGSGDMTGRVEAKSLESSISGSGDVKLSGHADNSIVSVAGSGDFTARSLVTVNTVIRVSGSGDAEVNASDRVDAAVNGSGDVRYTGGARNINSKKTGSGDISRF
jgi:hypothetical protein